MFGISWAEILLILGVALVVIGPKDMPRALYTAGKLLRRARVFVGDIQRSLDSVMKDEELDDIIREANKPGGDTLQMEIERQLQAEATAKQDKEKVEKNDSTN